MVEEPKAERLEVEEEEEEGGPVKSFLEHLEDLRWVLIKSVSFLAVAMLLCLIGGDFVVKILKRPLAHARSSYPGTNKVVTVLFATNKVGVFTVPEEVSSKVDLGTNRYVAVHIDPVTVDGKNLLTWRLDPDSTLADKAKRLQVDLLNVSPASGFFVAFQVALYGGAVLAAPFIFYFVAAFVFPALKLKERHYVYRGLFFGVGLFMTGVAFCYFLLMPIALAASQVYSQWLGFSAYQWKADEYISFVCKFMLGMGIGFEMPVVILTLVKIGVLSYRTLAAGRKYMIIINLVLGAVLTTPEVITQVIMFIPLQLLYEVSIWIAYYWEWRDRKREALAGGS